MIPIEVCPEPGHTEVLHRVRETMPEEITFERLAARYRLLSDPSRLQLLFALAHGELCGCDLTRLTGMTKYAVSHQLRTLRNHGLVRVRRDGSRKFYRLDNPGLIRQMTRLAVPERNLTQVAG